MLPPRIVGTELEYGMVRYDADGAPHTMELLSNEKLFNCVPDQYHGIGPYLPNGAKLYMDVGGHPEYASPESISIDDVVANECAGDQIIYQAMMCLAGDPDDPIKSFNLNRRVSDHLGSAWGYHENYSYETRYRETGILDALALHVATRNVYAGAGGLDKNGNFLVAQKGRFITCGMSSSTTGGVKPLIALRDNEPHADPERWCRANVVGGDPNMSPWASRLKLGSTILVMDMVEHGYEFNHLWPVGTISQLAKLVAGDVSLSRTVTLVDGRTIRPLEIQREIYASALSLSQDVELGAEKTSVLQAWDYALSQLEAHGSEALRDRADWTKRLQVIETYAGRHDLPPWSPKLKQVDLLWDSLHAEGIGRRLQQGLWQPWMPSAELIEERTTQPPPDTRAALRSRLIRAAMTKRNRRMYDVDWSNVSDPYGYMHTMPNPFIAGDEGVVTNPPFQD